MNPPAPAPSSAASETQFDAGAELHSPELYAAETGAIAFGVERLEDIGPREMAHYRNQGYLVVRQAFTSGEVASAVAGLLHLIMGGNPAFDGIQFEAQAQKILGSLTLDQRQDVVRKVWFFTEFEPRLQAFARDPRLVAVVRQLMGGAEPFMFQDMALVKPPHLGREKPWHQDHAYFDYPLGTPVVGVWIALDEATVANGCMHLLPGRHKEGPIPHFKRRDWQICDSVILGTRALPVPLQPGGLLLFDGLLPHGTPHNSSANRRRALQFHYAPAGITKTTTEERMRVFGSEGKDVTC
jgi:phytanoyl-CoA hydroxylase